MYYWTPKRIKELKARGYKLREVAHDPGPELTSSQAEGGKHPNQRTRAQASSQSAQAPGSDDQGTSAQAHGPGCKQQG